MGEGKENVLKLEKPVVLHSDEITQIIEIVSPCLCILTAGLDKRIVMFSLIRNETMRVLPQHHTTSIRNLVYFKDYGHLVLSSGSEKDILVWSIENMVTDPL